MVDAALLLPQGLGLPNMALEKLSELLMWLQCHWDVGEGMGLIVREAYERLQIETGLSGNVFLRDYPTYECLATHTWYKVFWQYLHRYSVRLELGDGYDVPLVRERDQVFMEVALAHTPHHDWPYLNRVRHHKGIFLLLQAVHANGILVRHSCLTRDPRIASNMVFPVQQPTAANFEVWRRTLYNISSPALRLGVRLGWLHRLPYDRVLWRVYRVTVVWWFMWIPGAKFPHYFYHPPPTQLTKAVATLAHSVPFLPMLHYPFWLWSLPTQMAPSLFTRLCWTQLWLMTTDPPPYLQCCDHTRISPCGMISTSMVMASG